MDKDLEELKVKAQQMLKKCREGDLSVENLPDVRKSLNNLLNDIKSHKLLEDVEFMKIAKELGNEVVNFINTDLAELQKSAEEKISAAVDERELQDAKVFYLGKKGKLSPRFVGPFEILEKIGTLAYCLALPPNLSQIHNVFHVSMLRKYEPDLGHILDHEVIEMDEKRIKTVKITRPEQFS